MYQIKSECTYTREKKYLASSNNFSLKTMKSQKLCAVKHNLKSHTDKHILCIRRQFIPNADYSAFFHLNSLSFFHFLLLLQHMQTLYVYGSTIVSLNKQTIELVLHHTQTHNTIFQSKSLSPLFFFTKQ